MLFALGLLTLSVGFGRATREEGAVRECGEERAVVATTELEFGAVGGGVGHRRGSVTSHISETIIKVISN
jgi:hypothetical protein